MSEETTISEVIANDQLSELKKRCLRIHDFDSLEFLRYAVAHDARECFAWLIQEWEFLPSHLYMFGIQKNALNCVRIMNTTFPKDVIKVWQKHLQTLFTHESITLEMTQHLKQFAMSQYEKRPQVDFRMILEMHIENLPEIFAILGHHRIRCSARLFAEKSPASRFFHLMNEHIVEALFWFLSETEGYFKNVLAANLELVCFQSMERQNVLPAVLLRAFDQFGTMKHKEFFKKVIDYTIFDQGSLDCACAIASRFSVHVFLSRDLATQILLSIGRGTVRFHYNTTHVRYLLSFDLLREASYQIAVIHLLFTNLPHSQPILDIFMTEFYEHFILIFEDYYNETLKLIIASGNIDALLLIIEKFPMFSKKIAMFAIHCAVESGFIDLLLYILQKCEESDPDFWNELTVRDLKQIFDNAFARLIKQGNLNMISFMIECGICRNLTSSSTPVLALLQLLYFTLQCENIRRKFASAERGIAEIVIEFLNYGQVCPPEKCCFSPTSLDIPFLQMRMKKLNIASMFNTLRENYSHMVTGLQNPTPRPLALFT